jgi:dipeptidyl aminopeptidase/acylaminoacyl peptidase
MRTRPLLPVILYAISCWLSGEGTRPATAAARITHEELWTMRRVGSPVPSPDGKWVVFLLTMPSYEQKNQSADLWIVPSDGSSPPRQLTQTKAAESGAAWSPDSRRVAFSTKREGDEAAQIYMLDINGGEAERVTNLTLGARGPKWSPDGMRLLFVSDTFPGCADEEASKKAAKERKDRKYNARVYSSFPIRYWDRWLDDKKAHLFVQEARPGAAQRDLFGGTRFADNPAIGPQHTDEGQSIEAEWAPDGKEIVFIMTVNMEAAARAYLRTQIFAVPAEGGEPQNLTNDPHIYEQMAFSPDGKTLFCGMSEGRPDQVYELAKLVSFPWPFNAMRRRVLTAAFDRSIGRFAFPAGSDRVWFSAEDAGLEKLYSVTASGGEVREEKLAEGGCFTGLAAGGRTLVAKWDTATRPSELFALGIPGSPMHRLTGFNTEKAAEFDLAPAEHFWFTSSRGKRIHSMLIRPPAFDPQKKYPLFAVIHGGAANMWRDSWGLRWNYHLLGSPGYAILLIDYTGSTGYGEKFSQEIKLDPLRGPAEEINEAVDAALKKFPFLDAQRLAAGGASYGGHLANWLQATTNRYKCFISHAGEADLIMQWGTSDSIHHREVNSGTPIWGDSKVWRDQSAVLQAGNREKAAGFVTPILITVGELDFRVPMNNAIMFFALQQRLQTTSRLIVFPEENHWITNGENSRFWFSEVHAWLAQYLGKTAGSR